MGATISHRQGRHDGIALALGGPLAPWDSQNPTRLRAAAVQILPLHTIGELGPRLAFGNGPYRPPQYLGPL